MLVMAPMSVVIIHSRHPVSDDDDAADVSRAVRFCEGVLADRIFLPNVRSRMLARRRHVFWLGCQH